MTAFDTLFWLLVAMLAVVAYAIEAGIATRNRGVVLTTLFSVIASIFYIMLFGDENSIGRSWSSTVISVNPSGPQQKDLVDMDTLKKADILAPKEASVANVEKKVPRSPFTDCEGCPSMIGIPAGRFRMGTQANQPGHKETEGPVDANIEQPYAIGRFEVTRDQFMAFVNETRAQSASSCLVNGRMTSGATYMSPGYEQAGNHPVVCVGYRDARAYAAWLSRKTGKQYRLLSEAEWEYAARAGAKTLFANGDAANAGNGNFNRSRDGTIPVGFTAQNAFLVHDTIGNVWEIVEDCWNPELSYNNGDGRATTLRGDCSQRVIKGGAWDSDAMQVRPATRATIGSTAAANTVGFRVARALD